MKKNRKSETGRRTRARYVPRSKETESKMKVRRNRTRKDSQVYSRRLNVMSTSKIVEKLYDGQNTTEKEAAPELPRPAGRAGAAAPAGRKERKGQSFAWQPTGDDDKNDDMYNWEYFLDSRENEQRGHEFDTLFTEEGDEMAYDHYYESTAYQPGRKKNNDRVCTACTQDARMCRMEKCTIS
uniref:Uncharacterized protein n=1 Tax=Lotharella oceanica TaxID=641309 RepID=A0A7S2TH98_9EUKA|mmetsp:Transcript_13835/g.26377  ORF Transcript_13835/g.26377 Transcript_13835/m.26377 type:complete len:182 (+) Transcript_13835:125-670(+)